MLKSIRFKFGPTSGSAPIEIEPGAMTVIVGPNNSGKSLTLQELYRSLVEGDSSWSSPRWQILSDIEPGLPPPSELRSQVFHEIKSDLSYLRPQSPSEKIAPKALAMLLGKADAEGELLANRARWLPTIASKLNIAEMLIKQRKLRRPGEEWSRGASRPSLGAVESTLKPKELDLLKCFEDERRSLMALIHAVNESSDEALISTGIVDFHGYFTYFRKQSLLLDGQARLSLASEELSASLIHPPTSTIMRLWHEREDLARLRALVLDAVGHYLCVDLTNLGRARLVLSEKPPLENLEVRLDAEAREFFAAARMLSAFSDGVRAYVGLHAELIAQDRRFIMVDEPEAFLHPPLARRLGFNLSTLAAERGSCVFAATHSPDFLMGCIESGVGVNIVRLGYHNGRPSAHLLPRDELQTMMVDPLLRSTGILGALFHQAAVVVEGDSDRAFYSEINERLRIHEPATHPAIMRDCVFLNAQGKATVSRILGALRRVGVVSCGIVDLDLLKDSKICTNLVRARGAPESVCSAIGYTRSQVEHSVKNLPGLCKPNGLAGATEAEREGVRHFIREMEGYGIFLPEVGPVEGWLSSLGVEVRKGTWIPAIFDAMGPVNTGLKPVPGDVWQFVRRIGRFLDEQRTPSEAGASGSTSN